MPFFLLSFMITTLDQIIKYLVHQNMGYGSSLPLLAPVIKLTYVRNTGIAFSLLIGHSSFLAVVGLLIAGAVVYCHFRLPVTSYYLQTALAFILGGSLGNIIDRFCRHYVIDYVDLTFWPVFNLADIMINLGVIMLVWQLLFSKEKNASNPL